MRLSVSRWRLVYISAVALLTACTLDGIPSAPRMEGAETRAPPIPRSDVLRNKATRTGFCDVNTIERDAKGKFLRRGEARRRSITLRTEEQDSLVSTYGALRFDELGRQSHEAFCQLPRGRAALAILGQLFSEPTGNLLQSPIAEIAHTIGVGSTCYWIDDDPDSINYDIICGGDVCTLMPGELLRAPPSSESFLRTAMPIGPHSTALAVWQCGGGGGISLGFDGLFTYHVPGSELPSSSPSGGGGGTPCGGGSTPPDTTGGKWSPDDQLRWGANICGDSLSPSAPPEGWPWEEWDKLSAGEKALVLANPYLWTFGRYLHMGSLRTESYIESLRIVGLSPIGRRCDDDEQNAYQHALFAAGIARAYGPTDARRWTEAHEDLGRQLTQSEYRSRQMDLLNNEVGIGSAGASGPTGTAAQDVWQFRALLTWFSNETCPQPQP